MSPVIWIAASLYFAGVVVAGCLHYKAAKLNSVRATGSFSKKMLDQWTAAGSRLDESINQSFKYQEVRIDGRKFVGCSFTHVNLFYDGTLPFHFDNCQFDPDTMSHFHTNNPAMAQWTELLRTLGVLKPDTNFVLQPRNENPPV
jgi:SAM-dependent methyltransferase